MVRHILRWWQYGIEKWRFKMWDLFCEYWLYGTDFCAIRRESMAKEKWGGREEKPSASIFLLPAGIGWESTPTVNGCRWHFELDFGCSRQQHWLKFEFESLSFATESWSCDSEKPIALDGREGRGTATDYDNVDDIDNVVLWQPSCR